MTHCLHTAIACAVLALVGTAHAGSAEDLIAANKCAKCHAAKTTAKGPSFAAIADKYKGQADAPAKLVALLKTGGADDHSKLATSDADLRAVVAFVLASR